MVFTLCFSRADTGMGWLDSSAVPSAGMPLIGLSCGMR